MVLGTLFEHPEYERREGLHHEIANGIVGVSTWLFFGLSIITVFIFLLGSINDDFEFRSTAIFLFIMIGSFMMTMMLLLLSEAKREHVSYEENDLMFFMNDVDLVKLLWIPLCFALVLVISAAMSGWNYEYAPHITLLIAGFVLFVGFERTGTIIVPILSHGFYNSVVVYLDFQTDGLNVLLSTAIKVPEIGISVASFNKIITEMIFQIVLVAAAEEMFKVFVIIFTVVAIRAKFDTDLRSTIWIGGMVSIIVWMTYHTILAIPG